MPRVLHQLSAAKVSKVVRPGRYPDGGGLFLQVTENGKSWIYRYKLGGRAREMGLGAASVVSLAQARRDVEHYARQKRDGIDPIEARRAERARAALDLAGVITFKDCAEQFIRANRAGWRNAVHAAQWESTLEAYAYPIVGHLAVRDVDTPLALRILEPIWESKPETASRVRGRVEKILDYGKVRGYRDGENPARWRGHLDQLLPKPARVRSVKHHAALAYEEVPEFMALLRRRSAPAARALEFAILTVARTRS